MFKAQVKTITILHLFSILIEICSSSNRYNIYRTARTDMNLNDKIKKMSETKKLYFQKSNMNNKLISGFDLDDGEIEKFKLWKDGVIPYYIDVVSYSDKALRDEIRSFLGIVNSVTSLNFQELPSPPEDENERWVFFVNRQGQLGCGDHSIQNFTTKGVQQVVLGYDCLNSKGELPDAVLAIAGVPPQHNAPDRDDYIKVYTENILPDKVQLFNKLNDDDWLFHDLEYDFNSVSHYDSFKYSAQGKAVLEPMDPDHNVGETSELSHLDVLKLRMLYNYIARKKRLDLSECEKLFMTNTNFDTYKKTSPKIKPIRKPNKYLGLDENAVPEGDYQEFEDYYHDDKLKLEPKSNESGNNTSNNPENEEANDPENEEAINTEVPPLDDANPAVEVKYLNLKRPGFKPRKDPLSALSDYDTDDEKRHRKVLYFKWSLHYNNIRVISDKPVGTVACESTYCAGGCGFDSRSLHYVQT